MLVSAVFSYLVRVFRKSEDFAISSYNFELKVSILSHFGPFLVLTGQIGLSSELLVCCDVVGCEALRVVRYDGMSVSYSLNN